jgi:hypothetical protein
MLGEGRRSAGTVLVFAAGFVASCGSSPRLSAGPGADAAPEGATSDDARAFDANDAAGGVHDGDSSPEGGTTGMISGADVVVDGRGSVTVVGTLDGTVDLGGGPLVSAGNGDLLLAQFDPGGTLQWGSRFGDAQRQGGGHLAVDGSDDLVLATSFQGQLDFGKGTLQSAGGLDVGLIKLDAAGHALWNKRFGDALDQTATAVAVDAAGRIALAVQSDSPLDFGMGIPDGGRGGGSIVQFTASGDVVRADTWGGVSVTALAVDSSGEVLATGYFQGTVDFGGGPLVSAGLDDIFVLELTQSGVHKWSRRFGGYGTDRAAGIAVDTAGNLLLTGYFDDTLDLGGTPLVSVKDPSRFGPADDVFVAQLDGSGNPLWSRQFGNSKAEQHGVAVGTDSSNDVLVIGWLTGAVDFGAGPVPSPPANAFAVKIDPSGKTVWSRGLGGQLSGVRAGLGGNVFVAEELHDSRGEPSPLKSFVGGGGTFMVELPP